MGNILFKTMLALGSGGRGTVPPVDYTEFIVDYYANNKTFTYMTDSQDAYYEVDGEVYQLQYSPYDWSYETYTSYWNETGKNNIKIHNVTNLLIDFKNDLYEVKRLGSTFTDYLYLFSSAHGVSDNGIDFTFPASDLKGDVLMKEMLFDTYIKSFPDISQLIFSNSNSEGYQQVFAYAYFMNWVDISTLVPTFYNEDNPIYIDHMYTSAINVSGTIPADKTWNAAQWWGDYVECFTGLYNCDNYYDAANAGWASY